MSDIKLYRGHLIHIKKNIKTLKKIKFNLILKNARAFITEGIPPPWFTAKTASIFNVAQIVLTVDRAEFVTVHTIYTGFVTSLIKK